MSADLPSVSRRESLKWIGVVAATLGYGGPAGLLHAQAMDRSTGYGSDPNLLTPPKTPWPLVLTPVQRATAVALLDVILPGSGAAPAASAAGLVDFLDEWVSAQYPEQAADRPVITALLDHVAGTASVSDGTSLDRAVQAVATSEAPDGAAFRRLCVLAAAAYYTTPAGFEAIGFVGNVPRTSFDGPPQPVLDHLVAELRQLD